MRAGAYSNLQDANSNQRVFVYNEGNTQETVQNGGTIAETWTQSFDVNKSTGSKDAQNHTDTTAYTDTTNPYQPTQVSNKNQQSVGLQYDAFGNVTQTTAPVNGQMLTTTYAYTSSLPANDPNYDASMGPLGQAATQITQGSKAPTKIAYYLNNTKMWAAYLQPNGAVRVYFHAAA